MTYPGFCGDFILFSNSITVHFVQLRKNSYQDWNMGGSEKNPENKYVMETTTKFN